MDNVAKKNGNLLTLLKPEVDCNDLFSFSSYSAKKKPLFVSVTKLKGLMLFGKLGNRWLFQESYETSQDCCEDFDVRYCNGWKFSDS